MRTFAHKTRYLVEKYAPFTPVAIAYGYCLPDMTIGYIGFESMYDYERWMNSR